jgi:FMN reductase
MRIAVVTAGLSSPSSSRLLADELAAATRGHLAAAGVEVLVDVIEVREFAHALIDNLLTGFPSPQLQAAIEQVTRADGLIAVTPIFTASYSALFKAFFDVLDTEAVAGKPVLIAATGGTERQSLALDHALRPLFGYLRAYVVPTAVYAASADFGSRGDDTARLRNRIERAAGEFATLLTMLDHQQVADPFDEPIPFEQLLAG